MDVMDLMTVGLDVAIVHLKQFVPGYKSKYLCTYLLSTKESFNKAVIDLQSDQLRSFKYVVCI